MLPEEDWLERSEAGSENRNTAIPKDGLGWFHFLIFLFYSSLLLSPAFGS